MENNFILRNLLKEQYGTPSELDDVINKISDDVFDYIINKKNSIINQRIFTSRINIKSCDLNTPFYNFKISLRFENSGYYTLIETGGGTAFFNLKLEKEKSTLKNIIKDIETSFDIKADFKYIFEKGNEFEIDELKEQIRFFFFHEINLLSDYCKNL